VGVSLSGEPSDAPDGPADLKQMFDLDPGKLIVIGIVALIAIPSKDLPRVLRTVGQATARARRMAAEFKGQFMEAMREAELADLQKEIEETNKSIMASTKFDGAFDPLTEARKQIVSAIETPPQGPGPDVVPAGRDLGDAADEAASGMEAAASPFRREEDSGTGKAGGSSDKAET
jgi:sec-independent protein translocase protein TatB